MGKWDNVPGALVETMRALLPLVYIRVKDPDALIRTMGEAVDGTRVQMFPIFLTTEPERKNIVKNFSAWRHGGSLPNGPDPGKSPFDILTALAECDPADQQALALVKVQDNLLSTVREPCEKLWDRRYKDPHWTAFTVFTGTSPATAAVPDDLKYRFYPIDLIEPALPSGTDSRARPFPATDEALQKLFAYVKDAIKQPGDPLSEEALARLRGMDVYEANGGMALSLVRHLREEGSREGPAEALLVNPMTIDAYKNRWARVA